MGGRNQDTANLRASPGQMNKVEIKIPPLVFHFACLKNLSNFNFGRELKLRQRQGVDRLQTEFGRLPQN